MSLQCTITSSAKLKGSTFGGSRLVLVSTTHPLAITLPLAMLMPVYAVVDDRPAHPIQLCLWADLHLDVHEFRRS